MTHQSHQRHPDCLDTLPVDSCHWEDCEKGVSGMDRLCYHKGDVV